MYCSGVITDQPVAKDSYVISGEDSGLKTTFMIGDYVYINQGAENGVKVGDQFDVVRAVTDMAASTVWFKYQLALSRAMGTRYADIGRLTVVHVDAKTATTQVSLGCDLVQRGDIVRPFVARPAPQYHEAKLDMFAPPSGKKMAMIVTAKRIIQVLTGGPGQIIYVNLGAADRASTSETISAYSGTRARTSRVSIKSRAPRTKRMDLEARPWLMSGTIFRVRFWAKGLFCGLGPIPQP